MRRDSRYVASIYIHPIHSVSMLFTLLHVLDSVSLYFNLYLLHVAAYTHAYAVTIDEGARMHPQ